MDEVGRESEGKAMKPQSWPVVCTKCGSVFVYVMEDEDTSTLETVLACSQCNKRNVIGQGSATYLVLSRWRWRVNE